MDDLFYEELARTINKSFDKAFGRKPQPKKEKKTMEPQFANEQQGMTPLSGDAQRILEAVRATDEPQGKTFLVNASGIGVLNWNTAINELKSAGLVTQIGNKRGAKYKAV